MPAKLKPQKFRLEGCTKLCTLNPDKLPGHMGDTIHGFYEMGDNDPTIVEKARLLGIKLSAGSVGRHRARHLIPMLSSVQQVQAASADQRETIEKVDDLTVLERIISKGASGIDLSTVRITPEMTIRAIELKYKLTQGSAFESFLAAIGGTMEEVTGRTDDPAEASAEEQEQVAADAAPAAE